MKGCGGEGSWFVPPKAIFFHTSCVKHDDYYEEGGTEFYRWRADYFLLHYMMKDVFTQVIWYKMPYYFMWCFFYYIGVVSFGWYFFNYK